MRSSPKLILTSLLATTVMTAPSLGWAQAAPPSPDQTASSAQEAEPEPEQSDEVVVRGFIPNVKRTTSEVSSILTLDDLERTGESDIAGALTRVTGLSLVSGKFVFVRGLGERYSNATLDGSPLSSPEPLRRVVPLDIIPTSLLGGVTVQKTFSVENSAEFGGGLIAIKTRAVPKEPFFEVSGSVGFNTASVFQDGLRFDSGGAEWTGIRGNALDIPIRIQLELQAPGSQTVFSRSAAQSLPSTYSLDRETNIPDFNLKFAGGLPFKLAGHDAGFLIAFDYNESLRNQFGTSQQFDAQGDLREAYSPAGCASVPGFNTALSSVGGAASCGRLRTNFDVKVNALGVLSFELNPNNIFKYTTTLLRDTNEQARILRGTRPGFNVPNISSAQQFYVTRQLYNNQLTGEHTFGFEGPVKSFDLDWRVAYSRSQRTTPFTRNFTYALDDSTNTLRFSLPENAQFNSTGFTALSDDNYEGGIDTDTGLDFGGHEVKVKAGIEYQNRTRIYNQRLFSYLINGANFGSISSLLPELILQPANIGGPGDTGRFQLRDVTNTSDSFNATFQNYAAYVSVEAQLLETLRWTAGVRYENSRQTVSTFFSPDRLALPIVTCGNRLFDLTNEARPQNVPINCVQKADLLFPASTLTWEFADNLQLRLGYSETVNRPDLRELSNATFFNEETDFFETGDPSLRISRIRNYDARSEWYFGRGQSATVGVFYKTISNAIEEVVTAIGELRNRQFANQGDAKLFGVEVELEADIPVQKLIPGKFFESRRLFVNGNFSYIDSTLSVTNQGAAASNSRPLQGQSRFLGNFQLAYDRPDGRERAALLVNYQGPRLFLVGSVQGGPDVIDTPPILVDFTFAKTFNLFKKDVEFGLEARNLWGDEYRLTQGGRVFETYEIGRTVTTSVKVSF